MKSGNRLKAGPPRGAMKPSWDELEKRDLAVVARGFAACAGTTVEEMCSRSRRRGPTQARRQFIRDLVEEQGWPQTRAAALFGLDPSTVNILLRGRKR
jgi:hypothetical protein